MRILIFTSQVSNGSAELLSVDFAKSLLKKNQKVFLVSLQPFSKHNSSYKSLPKNKNLEILSLNIRPKADILKLIKSIIRLRKILLKNKVNAIETSSPALACIASFSIWGTKIKLFSGIHETFYKGSNRIKGGNTNSIRKRIYAFLTRPRRNIYFYAVSHYVKKTWIDYSGINSERIKVIYDAINLPEKQFDKNESRDSLRKELKLSKNSKIALCVGRIVSYRRQDFLIEVFSQRKINENLVLLIVGEPDYSVPSTKDLVLKINKLLKNSRNKIKLLGQRSDIYKIMYASDFLVHPTDMEGFGLALVEAMYTGLPIIASKVEAIPEIIPESGNILFEKDNKKLLIESILKMNKLSQADLNLIGARNKSVAKRFGNREIRSENLLNYMNFICENN